MCATFINKFCCSTYTKLHIHSIAQGHIGGSFWTRSVSSCSLAKTLLYNTRLEWAKQRFYNVLDINHILCVSPCSCLFPWALEEATDVSETYLGPDELGGWGGIKIDTRILYAHILCTRKQKDTHIHYLDTARAFAALPISVSLLVSIFTLVC